MRIIIPKLKSIHQVTGLILVLWIITFIWHERIIPWYKASNCNWDDISPHINPVNKVLLIADPQLIDNHTYPGRNSMLLKVSQHTVDSYLKKNYKSLMTHLQPDYVFFLGDYLDNGRSSTDEYFYDQLARFNGIFPSERFGYTQGKNFFLNVPGNHDIGISDTVKFDARTRFAKTFGPINTVVTVDNVDIISLDALSLLSDNITINRDVNFFLDANYNDEMTKQGPRILLSHVPFYRNPGEKTCGPLRESNKFLLTKGYQYQLVIDNTRTQDLLNRINPDLIFSGDDHDYCDINHNDHTREITVKSISMAMGIWKPAVQLLTFSNENETLNYETKLCYLPRPYTNVVTYIILAVVSGVTLLWCNFKLQSKRFNYTILPMQNLNSKKISNFLNDQDNEGGSEYSPSTTIKNYLPNYTYTKTEGPSPFLRVRTALTSLKKLHLPQFFKQAILLGTLVVCIYLLFCMTV